MLRIGGDCRSGRQRRQRSGTVAPVCGRPHGILQDQQLGTVEPFDLGHDYRGHPSLLRGVALLGLDIEAAGLLPLDIMLGSLAGIEAHGVEIGDRDAPAQGFQRAARDRGQIGVVGLGSGCARMT